MTWVVPFRIVTNFLDHEQLPNSPPYAEHLYIQVSFYPHQKYLSIKQTNFKYSDYRKLRCFSSASPIVRWFLKFPLDFQFFFGQPSKKYTRHSFNSKPLNLLTDSVNYFQLGGREKARNWNKLTKCRQSEYLNEWWFDDLFAFCLLSFLTDNNNRRVTLRHFHYWLDTEVLASATGLAFNTRSDIMIFVWPLTSQWTCFYLENRCYKKFSRDRFFFYLDTYVHICPESNSRWTNCVVGSV